MHKFLNLVLAIALGIYTAWVLTWMWFWFVPLTVPSLFHMYGLLVMVSMILHRVHKGETYTNQETTLLIINRVLYVAVAFGFAWVASKLM